MDKVVLQALEKDRLVDISTQGRKSGQSHRVEVGLRLLDGEIYLSNNPGPRDWAANLLAKPEFVYHIKQSLTADIPALATPISDAELRRNIFTRILTNEGRLDQLAARMEKSHLFRVELLSDV